MPSSRPFFAALAAGLTLLGMVAAVPAEAGQYQTLGRGGGYAMPSARPAPQPYPQPYPQPQLPAPATQVFSNPQVYGLPLDICTSPWQQCGGEAANAFCQQQGYAYAVSHATAIYPATAHLAGGTCQPALFKACGGYTRIVCTSG